jgi:predicted nucleotidyltransferase
MNKELLNQIKDIVKQIEEIEFAYLFGSCATDSYTQNSDIDIAIFVKDGQSLLDTHLHTHHQLEINLHKEIDVVTLNNAKNFHLVKDILDQGIVLKESIDDKRQMYEIYKRHEVLDFFQMQSLIYVDKKEKLLQMEKLMQKIPSREVLYEDDKLYTK